ncbi:MAG: CHASE2 domain-containing protein, partial [Candidatus Electrothrix sp. ATG1]|nr:CHASE2 domain-containing protein [Candidatus Electrothrix sp. ATG1]
MSTSPDPGGQTLPDSVSATGEKRFESLLLFILALLPTSIIAVLSVSSLPVLSEISLKIYDSFLLSGRSTASANAPLIVDIDEQSLNEYGQWPWPRFLVAELLKKIQEEDPLAVGVDIMFSEPDRTSLSQIYKNIEAHFDIKIPEAQKLPKHLRENDSLLADVLRQGNFVTSISFTPDRQISDHNCTVHPLNIIIHQQTQKSSGDQEPLGQANRVICNLPLFDKAVSMNGFINVEADSDGILRKVPLLMKYQDKILPHLSLATLIAAFNPETLVFRTSLYGTSGIVFDEHFIPLDNHGNFA